MFADKKGRYGKKSGKFKVSMQKLIEMLKNNDCNENIDMNKIETMFNINKRRFYDTLKVLEVIGVCEKESTTFKWNGLSNIVRTIRKIAEINGAFSNDKKLAEVIPTEECISIGKVTEQFILCFIGLQKQTLNIKEVSIFLSRDNNRFKTTICKLYMISLIFVSIGIAKKTENASEFRLEDQYFIPFDCGDAKIDSFYSIESLLNKKDPSSTTDTIEKRRIEFYSQQSEDIKLSSSSSSS